MCMSSRALMTLMSDRGLMGDVMIRQVSVGVGVESSRLQPNTTRTVTTTARADLLTSAPRHEQCASFFPKHGIAHPDRRAVRPHLVWIVHAHAAPAPQDCDEPAKPKPKGEEVCEVDY